MLPEIIKYYGKSAHNKLAELADAAGFDTAEKTTEEKAEMFINAVEKLNERLNISSKLDVIKREDIELIARRAIREATPTYPVPRLLTTKDLEAVIYKISSLQKLQE